MYMWEKVLANFAVLLVFVNIIFDQVKQVSLFKFNTFWYILLIIKNEDLPFFLCFYVKIIIVFILIIF